jgi:multiple sugar transport system substrate-binding protein
VPFHLACRRTIAVLAVIACSIVLAACGGSDDDDGSGGGGAAGEFPTGDITLTIWDTAEDTKNELFKEQLIPDYEAKHPNVKIEYSFYPTADLAAKEFVALGNGQGPSIFSVQGTNFSKMFAGDFVAPAEDAYFPNGGVKQIEDQYLPGALDSVKNEGKLYGLPNQQNSWSLYINNRLFKEAGLDPEKDAPETWDDVAALNPKLTKEEGGRVTQKGFDFRYQTGDNWLVWAFSVLNYQAGGDVLTDDEPQWTGAEGVKAMETWKATASAPRISNNTGSSPYQDFADEKEAMAVGGPNMGKFVVSINPKMEGNYTVVPMPQMDPGNPVTFSYSFNLAVNSNLSDEEKHVAWDFIDFALKDPLLWWETTAMLQPRKGAYESPEAQRTVGMNVFVDDLEVAKPLARTIYWDELQRIVASAAQGIVLEDQDIQDTLDSAAEEFRRVAGK